MVPNVKAHDAELAGRLVDEAARLLTEQGPAALTTRAVTAAAGTSTTAVYALFGGKAGLVREMYDEGFRRLGAALRAVPVTEDLAGDLLALGCRYRQAALANPQLYELMFAHPVPGFRPDAGSAVAADEAYQPLREAVRRCADAGRLRSGSADDVATHLWATVHGLVSLELHDWLSADEDERETRFTAALLATGGSYLLGESAPSLARPRGQRRTARGSRPAG